MTLQDEKELLIVAKSAVASLAITFAVIKIAYTNDNKKAVLSGLAAAAITGIIVFGLQTT